jgi:carbon storage regulator
MLVLSRKQGEGIRIGNEIEVTVLEVRGGRVKLGLRAPRSVPVHRDEVHERIAEWQPNLDCAECA